MPRPRLAIAAVLGLLVAATPASALEARQVPEVATTVPTAFSPDRVIVQWADGADHGDKAEARTEADVEFESDLGNRDFQLVTVGPRQTPAEAVGALESDPAVAVVERDGYRSLDSIPNDPLFNQLWGLQNIGAGIDGVADPVAGDDINAIAAWDRTVGTPTTVVADIDSGYRFDYPDLGSVAWTNPGESATANGADDDSNGVIDDLHGADFVGISGSAPAIDGDPTDDDPFNGGHGVHTAGTMGAAGNNVVGITGVAQNVRIMPLRVCSRFASEGTNRCPFSAILSAINYAGAKGARVANMSLGGNTFTQTEVNAIAANPDVLYVISAGNDGSNNDVAAAAPHGHHYPCDYQPTIDASPAVPGAIDNIVCVAATDQADGLASFSDYGPTSVDIGAPGTETLSTYPYVAPVEETFSANDFATRWPASGANGGFQRTNEAPLTSFGITDVVGAPAANTIRATTSAPVSLPVNGGCKLTQTRRVVLTGGGHYRYSILLNGIEQEGSEPPSTSVAGLERRFLELPPAFKAGGSVEVRFSFTTGSAPAAGSGVWLDDVSLVCAQALGQASAFGFLQGTSMAAPHVTGAAGLLFSLKPSATVTEVRDALLAGADRIPALAGKTTSGGRLDVNHAMDALQGIPVDNLPPAAPTLSSTSPTSPAENAAPRIVGSAESSSTVRLYASPTCKGAPVAVGTAAGLASPGIAVSVPSGSTLQFSARATDAAANNSLCSAPISYTNTKIVVIGPGEVIVAPLVERPRQDSQPGASVRPPVIPSCRVPKLAGKTLGQAKSALSAAGCQVGKVGRPKARKGQAAPTLVVKSSSPAAGSLAPGDVVGLTLGPKPKKHHR